MPRDGVFAGRRGWAVSLPGLRTVVGCVAGRRATGQRAIRAGPAGVDLSIGVTPRRPGGASAAFPPRTEVRPAGSAGPPPLLPAGQPGEKPVTGQAMSDAGSPL